MTNATCVKQPELPSQVADSFTPIHICEIELSQPLPDLSAINKQTGQPYQRVRCLIRLHTQPLGLFELALGGSEAKAEKYVWRLWQEFGPQINAHLHADGLSEITGLGTAGLPALQTPKCLQEREKFLLRAPFASVVISTRDRPEQIARCVTALLAQQYPAYEVIVVDNAPATSATADLIQQQYAHEPRIRYVREDRPGPSAGRNRGIVEARGEIIAITDDDVVVDAYWLAELAKGFEAAENVACVTGLLLPLALETPAQFLLGSYYTKGFSQRIFDLREHRWNKPAFPYIIGACGTGASMAFTAAFLRQAGGFDPAMGPATPTYGGEDLALLFRVIIQKYRLVYEPASLLYHQDRPSYMDLQKQMYAYGVGFTAYLTKIIIDSPWLIFDCFCKFVRSLLFLWRHRSARPESKDMLPFPQALKRLEHRGQLRGPLAYIRSRLATGWRRKGLALAQQSAQADRAKKSLILDEIQASSVTIQK